MMIQSLSQTEGYEFEVVNSQTRQILVLDSNLHLSWKVARYILLSSQDQRRSCALFQLGAGAQPRLTYYELGLAERRAPHLYYNGPVALDFAVYVAASPHHVLAWLQESRPASLTVVTEVGLMGDTEVGLAGLLKALSEQQIPTRFVFISADNQQRGMVVGLLNQNKASFVVKGSPDWFYLPRRLVETSSRAGFQMIKPSDYQQVIGQVSFGPEAYYQSA